MLTEIKETWLAREVKLFDTGISFWFGLIIGFESNIHSFWDRITCVFAFMCALGIYDLIVKLIILKWPKKRKTANRG